MNGEVATAEQPESAESRRRSARLHVRRPRGMFFPVLLIGVGIILLLNTMNVLEAPLLPLLVSLWPVLFILIGLDILIGGRSAVGSLLIGLLMIAALAAAVFFAWLRVGEYGSPTHDVLGRPIHTYAEEMEAAIEFGAGQLEVGALPEPQDFAAEVDFSPVSGRGLDYSYRIHDGHGVLIISDGKQGEEFSWWYSRSSAMSVALTPGMPLSLDVSTGAGEAALDLTGLEIETLDAELGVGDLTVVLPEEGVFEGDVSVGVGKLTVVVPDGMAARIERDIGIGNLDIDESRFERDGAGYVTHGYAAAGARAHLSLEVGVGEIEVR